MAALRPQPDWRRRRQRQRPLWPAASLRLVAVVFLAITWKASLVHAAAEAEDPDPYGLVAPGTNNFSPFGDSSLVPRYFWDGIGPAIARRDDSSDCGSGFHSCLDINSTLCCANDRYCLIDPSSKQPACCAIGSTCGSACNETQYECTITSTITVLSKVARATTTSSATSTTGTSRSTAAATTTLASGVTTTHLDACCVRRCPATSMFECAQAFGGGCCNFGQTCASGNQCIWTASETGDGGTASNTVAAATGGCTAGQVSCAASMGGGCCDSDRSCVMLTSKAYCAIATPTGSGITVVNKGDGGGLSAGAKAGIGVGVAVGACAIIGGLTFCCLRKRSRSRRMSSQQQQQNSNQLGDYNISSMEEYRQQQQANGWSPLTAGGVGVFANHSSSNSNNNNQNNQNQTSQISPMTQRWRNPLTGRRNTGDSGPGGPGGAPGGPAESVVDGDSGLGAGRLRGLTQDYFGPNAVPGPFTSQPTGNTALDGGVGGALQTARGVPIAPHGPHDIVAPVEIDSTAKAEMDASPSPAGHGQPGANNGSNSIPGQLDHGEYGTVGTTAAAPAAAMGISAATMAQYNGHMTQMSLVDQPGSHLGGQISPNGMTLGQSRDVHNFDLGMDPGQMMDDPNEEKGERERRVYAHPGVFGGAGGRAAHGGVDVDDSALEEQPPPPQYGPDPHSVVNGHYELYGSDVVHPQEKSAAVASGVGPSALSEKGQLLQQSGDNSNGLDSGIIESPIDPKTPIAGGLDRFPPAPRDEDDDEEEDEEDEEEEGEVAQAQPQQTRNSRDVSGDVSGNATGDARASSDTSADASVGPVSPGSPTGSNEAVSPLESRSRAVSNVSNAASNPPQSPLPPLPDTLPK